MPPREPSKHERPGAVPQPGGFASRPLARLAELKHQLPSLPPAPPVAAAPADPGSPLAKVLRARLVISRDSRGRGGKTVTYVRGFVATPALLEGLAKELRHELGCGVRVEDGALVAQGALTERLAASLQKRGALRIVIGN